MRFISGLQEDFICLIVDHLYLVDGQRIRECEDFLCYESFRGRFSDLGSISRLALAEGQNVHFFQYFTDFRAFFADALDDVQLSLASIDDQEIRQVFVLDPAGDQLLERRVIISFCRLDLVSAIAMRIPDPSQKAGKPATYPSAGKVGNVDAFYPVREVLELVSFLQCRQEVIHQIAFVKRGVDDVGLEQMVRKFVDRLLYRLFEPFHRREKESVPARLFMQGPEFPLKIKHDFIGFLIILMFFMADDIDELPFIEIEDDVDPPLADRFDLDDVSGLFAGKDHSLLFGQSVYLYQNISQNSCPFEIMLLNGFLDLALDFGFDRFRIAFEE